MKTPKRRHKPTAKERKSAIDRYMDEANRLGKTQAQVVREIFEGKAGKPREDRK